MSPGVDGALAPVGVADGGRQPLGGLEIDDQAVLIEAPVEVTDDRDGHVLESDLDPILIGGRTAVLPELRQAVLDVAGEVAALGVAAPVRGQGHLAIERGLGRGDACGDLAIGVHQTDMDALLDGLAARSDRAGRRAPAQQPLHDPERRLGSPEVQGRCRQVVDAVALEAAAHRELPRQRPAGRRRRHRAGSVGLVCRAPVRP